jgi:putative heme transporter
MYRHLFLSRIRYGHLMRSGRLLLMAASMVLAVTLLVVVLPRTTGTTWSGTGEAVEGVSALRLLELLIVWSAGLWFHTLLLRASLPGLRTHRAFALNLGGSSISNVLPMGGAAGIGLNYAMLRSWGYSRVQISAFTAATNLVVAVIKVLMAAAGIAILWSLPVSGLSMPVPRPGLIGIVVALAVTTAVTAAFRASWRSQWAVGARSALGLAVAEVMTTVRRGWRTMVIGAFGYPALQAVLLWLCLQAINAHVGVPVVLLTYAVERLLTLVPFTPGGVGVVETGATAVLVAFGVDPASAVGGFLLFRVFSYLIEIPVGGVIAAFWWMRGPLAQR